MTPLDDTIAAITSPIGSAPRGILRISGPDTKAITARVVKIADPPRWENTKQSAVYAGTIALDDDCQVEVSVTLWPSSRSFTGQPAAEVHAIGSPPVLEEILQRFHAAGARPAQRGEFTLRAFLAGRLDLTQAEAVLGVIQASDQRQLEQALTQLGGRVSDRFEDIRERLLSDLADLEAGLDFVEEDIDFVDRTEFRGRLTKSIAELTQVQEMSRTRIGTGGVPRVVLAGLPNAGKSTLFNRLVERESALVSNQPGTTRDYLSAKVGLSGHEIELIDTAGWENHLEEITTRARELRSRELERAAVIVWCTASDLTESEMILDERLREELSQHAVPVLVILTKCDLKRGCERTSGETTSDMLEISCLDGDGIQEFGERVRGQLETSHAETGQLLASTAARCQHSLSGAIESLSRAWQLAEAGMGDELLSLELRTALHHLGEITGEIYTDDILDVVFSRFCIGK